MGGSTVTAVTINRDDGLKCITAAVPIRGIDYDDYRCDGVGYSRHREKELPQNCKNCGAPLHTHECEYCGTRY